MFCVARSIQNHINETLLDLYIYCLIGNKLLGAPRYQVTVSIRKSRLSSQIY